jgi:glutamine synthetase
MTQISEPSFGDHQSVTRQLWGGRAGRVKIARMETRAPEPLDAEATRQMLRTRSIQAIELWFTDLSGRPWRLGLAAAALTEAVLRDGLPLDGRPVGGAWQGVKLLKPQTDCLYQNPAASVPTLTLICDAVDPDGFRPLPLEPRHVLKRAQDAARDSLKAEILAGAEPEFILFNAPGSAARENEVWDFLRGLAAKLGDSGIRVDWFRTGPALGQGRVQMRAGPPLQLADRVMLYRHFAASLARGHSQTASFLPRPVAEGGTPGMPLHQALWKNDVNLFHDDSGWAATSELCRWYAAGLLAHLPAVLAFCAPTTNSYRRLIPRVCGPTETTLSTTARAAVCRIPTRDNSPAARRVKFCCCDSTANPYLAFAAVIMAGLDGVARRLECPLDGVPPCDARFPHSLEEALDGLSEDRGFLTARGVFSDGLIDAWIRDRWERHVLPVRSHPHPWEIAHADVFAQTQMITNAKV